MLATMTKHLVDIDDALLARAQAASGEKTIRATVEAGLKKLANDELTQRHVERLKSGYYDFDFDALEEARAPRVPSIEDDE
jgi:Arc/MetJ family transcription regulator